MDGEYQQPVSLGLFVRWPGVKEECMSSVQFQIDERCEFAGGMEFEPFPELYKLLGVDEDVWMRSPNITPDAKGVLANYPTAESWITRFRQGRIINFSPMDWGPFSRMSDEDLEAIWIYLQSLTPVENDVGPLIFKK